MAYTIKEQQFLRTMLNIAKKTKLQERWVKEQAAKYDLSRSEMWEAFVILVKHDGVISFAEEIEILFDLPEFKGDWVYGFLNKERRHLMTVACKELNTVVRLNFKNRTSTVNTIYDGNLIKTNDGYININTFKPLTQAILIDIEKEVNNGSN